ncbi:ABC transporter substrate-binding protein [Fodinicola acaciae]|uniref:ABC transporter substrate-binding protein n=1 Tax=Fodinicola acaciae TaxID=2681555 RepID=UPI0013D1110F|nr:ABC transporter substrate-binding protein [Fodinicola acaciae]
MRTVGLFLVLLVVAGCSSPAIDPNAQVITAAPVASVQRLVPPGTRTINAVMSIGNAPLHYPAPDGSGDMLGVDPDLAKALGGVMGVGVNVVGVTFDQIIPGLQSGRYDLSVSQMGITDERLKVLDFVEYFNSGTGIGTRAGNPLHLTVNSLCGHQVAVSNGSIQQAKYLPLLSTQCVRAGRAPIAIRGFPDQQKGVLALVSGRIDAVMVDLPVLQYAVRNVPDIVVADTYDAGSPVGIGLDKGNKLAPAVQAALVELRRSGIYQKILAKWAVQGNALSTFAVRTGK